MKEVSFLNGKSVLITRDKRDSVGFAQEIKKYGGIPTSIPMIGFQRCKLSKEEEKRLASLNVYDWIIFTSKKGVQFFFEFVDAPIRNHIAVIGDKTKDILSDYGYKPQFTPSKFVAECFVEEFIPLLHPDSKVLVVKGNLARNLIAEQMRKSGCTCDEIIVYDNKMPEQSESMLIHMLSHSPFDIITFTSSSTVHNFMSVVKKYQLDKQLSSATIACIGPIAAKTARQYGLQVDICAEVYTMEGLLHSLVHFNKKQI